MFTAYSIIIYIVFGIRCKRIIRVAANDNCSFTTQDRRMVSHAFDQQVALFSNEDVKHSASKPPLQLSSDPSTAGRVHCRPDSEPSAAPGPFLFPLLSFCPRQKEINEPG